MSNKKSTAAYRIQQRQSADWDATHTPGHPPLTEAAWAVDSEHGKISFANFESAYAYANGLSLGDFNRKLIDKERKLIEVWVAPEHIHKMQLATGLSTRR